MLRKLSRTLLVAGAAFLAGASALSAQTGTPVRGDVDGDGQVTAADARIVADYVVGKPAPPGVDVVRLGDVNGDGRVSSVDAAIIRAFAAGRNVSRFPVGRAAPASDVISVSCVARVQGRSVTCREAPGTGGSHRSDIIVGGQHENVDVTSSNIQVSGNIFSFDVTVKNLLIQSMGTTDGVTGDPNGVRIFFSVGPTTTVGTGQTVVANPDGLGTFTASNQPYFQYSGAQLGADGILAHNETSASKNWQLQFDPGVTEFAFTLFINTQVQYPDGWVDVYPPEHAPSPYLVPIDTLVAGQALQLRDSVRNAFGRVDTLAAATSWSATAHGAATVSGTGEVTAVADGVDSVTATSGTRTGHVVIVVNTPSAATSTITPAPDSVTAGGNSTITVQLKNGAGDLYTKSGGTVALSVASGTGSLGAVTNNNNGTYTATLSSNTAGNVVVAGTLNSVAIGDSATVTFTPGAAASMTANSATAQSDTVGSTVTAPPSVIIKDGTNNPVPGVAVTFTVTAGGGTVSDGVTPGSSVIINTNALGVATLTSWTLGTVAGAANSVTASSGALTNVVFTATAAAGSPATMTKVAASDGQSATAGTAVGTAPAVTIKDAFNNPVPGIPVTFAVASGGGSVTAALDSTDVSGVAAVGSWTLGNTAGANTLDASSPGLTTVTFTATGTPGPVHHFVVEAAGGGNISDQLAGTPFNVKVTAQDQHNNTATGFTGPGSTVDFTTTPPGGITAGATSAGFTAGVLASHAITIGTTGVFTLTATRASASGTSNSFQVEAAPTAVADGPAGGSVPGNPYHGAFNTVFDLPAPGIMANDNRGFPLATVVSFGLDSLGGTISSNAANGTPVSLPGHADGSLAVSADGHVVFTPPTGFTGLYVFQYRITNERGSSDAQVTIAVGTRPAAGNDTYPTNLLGNVPINTATSTHFRVTTNDAGDAKVLAIVPLSALHGTPTLNADSTFTFVPEAGYTGPASFAYTVKNGFGTVQATVSMTVSGIAWFVDKGAAAGDGRFGTPFNDLSTAFAAAVKPLANQPVFLYANGTSYTGGVTLLGGQRLVGQGATGTSFAEVMGVTWPLDAGPQPSINGTNPTVASGLTLGSGNTLQGFNLVGSGTLTGSSFGTLTISGVGINTTGQALNLSTGTITGSFPQVRSTGGTNNVSLTNVSTTGTTTLGTAADVLSGATGDAMVISGAGGSFTYAGNITNTATLAVNVNGKTGGTVTFQGDINPSAAARGISVSGNNSGTNTILFSGANQKISSGTAAGVNLVNNTGATISFTGGGLVITTSSGNGFNATGGGTVIVDAPTDNSTISSSGGIALNVSNTTIGGPGLNFRSISAAGGSNGILLNNTGAGALTVSGDGASDPANTTRGRTTAKNGGGSIALGSGGTLSNTSGHAVSLTSTAAVTLRNLVIQNGGGDGIAATTVAGLTVDNLMISGKALGHGLHGTSVNGLTVVHTDIGNNATDASTAGADIWNVRLDNLSGTGSVSSSLFHHGYEHIFVLKNTAGTTNFTATNSNFTDAGHGDGLDIYAHGTSNVTATVQNDSLARNSSFGFDSGTQTGASATLNVTLNNNQVINNFVGMDVAHGSSGTNTFNITNNNVQTNVASSSQAINVNRLADPSFTSFGLFSGTVSGNTIGSAGVPNSGSDVGDGITVKTNGNGGITRISILNNTIRSYGQHGIGISARDANTGHTLHARVQGNNIANGEPTLSLDGINVTMGALNTDVISMCLDIGGAGALGNTVSAAVRNGVRVRSSGLPAANVTLTAPGYDGSGATYFANRNPSATGASGNASFSNASGTTSAGSCTTP